MGRAWISATRTRWSTLDLCEVDASSYSSAEEISIHEMKVARLEVRLGPLVVRGKEPADVERRLGVIGFSFFGFFGFGGMSASLGRRSEGQL